jgi:hypothetical protein
MLPPGDKAIPFIIAHRAVHIEPTDAGWRATCSDTEIEVYSNPEAYPQEPHRLETTLYSAPGEFETYRGRGFAEPLSRDEFIEVVREVLEGLGGREQGSGKRE